MVVLVVLGALTALLVFAQTTGLAPVDPSREERAGPSRVEREVWLMGSRALVVAESDARDRATSTSEEVIRRLDARERRLSTWDSNSDYSRVNAAAPDRPTVIDAGAAGALHDALSWSDRTGGAFDPALGALIDAWGLRGEGRLPGSDELAELLQRPELRMNRGMAAFGGADCPR